MCTIRVLAHGAAHAPLPRSMLEWRTECAQAMQNFAAPARNAWCPWTRLAAQWTQWKLRKHRNHNFTRHRLQQVNLGDGVRHPSLHLLCALPEAGQRRGRHVARFTTSARPSAAACPGRFHGCVRVKLEVYDLTWPITHFSHVVHGITNARPHLPSLCLAVRRSTCLAVPVWQCARPTFIV